MAVVKVTTISMNDTDIIFKSVRQFDTEALLTNRRSGLLCLDFKLLACSLKII